MWGTTHVLKLSILKAYFKPKITLFLQNLQAFGAPPSKQLPHCRFLATRQEELPVVCFAIWLSALHSYTKFCKAEQKRPTPVRRRFSRAQERLGRCISWAVSLLTPKNHKHR